MPNDQASFVYQHLTSFSNYYKQGNQLCTENAFSALQPENSASLSPQMVS